MYCLLYLYHFLLLSGIFSFLLIVLSSVFYFFQAMAAKGVTDCMSLLKSTTTTTKICGHSSNGGMGSWTWYAVLRFQDHLKCWNVHYYGKLPVKILQNIVKFSYFHDGAVSNPLCTLEESFGRNGIIN